MQLLCSCRRVANIYFTLVAALSLTPYSPVRCAAMTHGANSHTRQLSSAAPRRHGEAVA